MAEVVFVPQSAMPKDWIAAVRRMARLAFADIMAPATMPEPTLTPLDLWRQARIEYLNARDRNDDRAVGVARRKMRQHAMADFTARFRPDGLNQSPRAPSA